MMILLTTLMCNVLFQKSKFVFVCQRSEGSAGSLNPFISVIFCCRFSYLGFLWSQSEITDRTSQDCWLHMPSPGLGLLILTWEVASGSNNANIRKTTAGMLVIPEQIEIYWNHSGFRRCGDFFVKTGFFLTCGGNGFVWAQVDKENAKWNQIQHQNEIIEA